MLENISTWDLGLACDQSEGEEYRAGLSIGMGPTPVRYICSKWLAAKLVIASNFIEASKKFIFKFLMTHLRTFRRNLTSFN